jgi:hypothetical protein
VMDGPLVAHAAAGPNVPIRLGLVWFGAQFARDRALRRGEQERLVELRSNRRCPNTTQEYSVAILDDTCTNECVEATVSPHDGGNAPRTLTGTAAFR